MQDLPNTTRSHGILEAFRDYRDIRENSQIYVKEIIAKANTVRLISIMSSYGININNNVKYIICPFPSHSESSASFQIYRETNSFHCWGCKCSGPVVRFVALMDGISNQDAAKKIIHGFSPDPNFVYENISKDIVERCNLHMSFSNMIYSFLSSNVDDQIALQHAEKICFVFDTINSKHELDVAGLKSLIKKLKIKLDQYKCQ